MKVVSLLYFGRDVKTVKGFNFDGRIGLQDLQNSNLLSLLLYMELVRIEMFEEKIKHFSETLII